MNGEIGESGASGEPGDRRDGLDRHGRAEVAAAAPERARARVFIATSADGFIARQDGAIDWLERAHAGAAHGEDFGYQAFFESVDGLVIGRRTFELVRGFDPWPYGDKPVVVLTRTGTEVPATLRDRVSTSAETPHALLERLGAQGLRSVYLDGGLAVQSFLREGLVDELIVTTVPVLIGQGRPLFGPLAGDVTLELVASRAHAGGCVQSRWRVAPRERAQRD